MRCKVLKVLCSATLISLTFSAVSFAGTWQSSGDKWRYQKDNYSYAASEWVNDNNTWYYMDQDGNMKTGWVLVGTVWYYMEPSGAMRTQPLTENQTNYYFNGDGACINPDGAPPLSAPQETPEGGTQGAEMSELQYVARVLQFLDEVDVASTAMENYAFDPNNIAGAIDILNSLKNPFVEFQKISPPAKYAAAQEHFKNGSSQMVQALDLLIHLFNSLDQNLITENQANEIFSQIETAINNAGLEFDAGGKLLDAALNNQ